MSSWLLPRISDYWDARPNAVVQLAQRLAAIDREDRVSALAEITRCVEFRLHELSPDMLPTCAWIMADDLYRTACNLSQWDDSLTDYLRASARPVLQRLSQLGYSLRYFVDNDYEPTPVGLALPAQWLPLWFQAAGFAFISPQDVAYRRIHAEGRKADDWTEMLPSYLPAARETALDALARCRILGSHLVYLDAESRESALDLAFDSLTPGVIVAFRNEPGLVSSHCRIRIIPPAPAAAEQSELFAGSTTLDDTDRLLFSSLGRWVALKWRDGLLRPPKGVPYGTHLATYIHCDPGEQILGLNTCWLVESGPNQYYRVAAPLVGIDATWLFKYATLRQFPFSPLMPAQLYALELPPADIFAPIPPELRAFRERRDLDLWRCPGSPDDLSVAYGQDWEMSPGLTARSEQVWIRVTGVLDDATFRGVLLNQPVAYPGAAGASVTARVLTIGGARMLVSSIGRGISMTASQAQSLIQRYGRVLMDSGLESPALLRPLSSLPTSGEQIQSAIRLLLPLADPTDAESLVTGYMDLGSFVPDEEASFANRGLQSRDSATLARANAILKASNTECQRLLTEIQAFVRSLGR